MHARVVLASTVFDTYFAGRLSTLELDRRGAVRRSRRTRRDGGVLRSVAGRHETALFTGGLGWIDRTGISRVSDTNPRGLAG